MDGLSTESESSRRDRFEEGLCSRMRVDEMAREKGLGKQLPWRDQ